MSLGNNRGRFGSPLALAARLKHRVSIEQRVRSADAAGGSDVSWSPVLTAWAELRSRSRGGDENAAGGKLEANITHEMTMRYRSGITNDMRVAYQGRVFNIRRLVNVDEAGVILELLLEEGVAS